MRAGRPQAARQLPPLISGPTAGAPPLALAREESQPILPPRESVSMPAAPKQSALYRRWPLVVMVIAGLAIVGAVVVMFALPPDKKDDAGLPPPPAPEKMQLNPLPAPPSSPSAPSPSPSDDPWGPSPGSHAQNTPVPAPRMAPDPLPPQAAQPADPFDDPNAMGGILGGLGNDPFGGLGLNGLGTNDMMSVAATFGRHACDLAAKCGIHDAMTQASCRTMRAFPAPQQQPTCDAAKRCLQQVDNLDCSVLQSNDTSAMALLMTQVPDCITAMTSC